MAKKVCAVLAVVAAIALLATAIIPAFAADAAETKVSLLPANASDFNTVAGGDGTVAVQANGDGYKFVADKGWPQAWYMGPESAWAVADVDDPNCYLEWDFEVVSGGANVIVFFAGQSPMDQATAGTGESINYYIDPANNQLVSNLVVDLPAGHYKDRLHVSETGIGEQFIGEDGTYYISGIKVFAVGGEVIVNDLSVVSGSSEGGEIDPTPGDDIVDEGDTAVESTLMPPSEADFTTVTGGWSGDEGTVTVSKEGDGYKFSADKGWPCAWYMGPESEWVTTNINDTDAYLEYDVEVVSGAAKVVVYFCGQNPADMAAPGAFFCVNSYEMPETVKPDGDTDADLGVGHYKAKVPLAELGYSEGLLGENGEMLISGFKVYAVGGDVVVNKLAIVSGSSEGDDNNDNNDNRDEVEGDDYGLSYTEWAEFFKREVYDYTNNVLFFMNAYGIDGTTGDIYAEAYVTSYNREPVTNITLDIPVPEGYTFSEGESSLTVDNMAYGDVVSAYAYFTKTAEEPVDPDEPTDPTDPTTPPTVTPDTPKQDGPKGDSPNTADVSNAMIAMIVALAAGAVVTVLCVKNKTSRQMLSLVLVCVVTLSAVATAVPAFVNAEEADTVATMLSVDIDNLVGEQVTVTAEASYDAMPANGTDWTEEEIDALYNYTGTAWANLDAIETLIAEGATDTDVTPYLQAALDATAAAHGLLVDHEDVPAIGDTEGGTLTDQVDVLYSMIEALLNDGLDLTDPAAEDTVFEVAVQSVIVDNGAFTLMEATYYAMQPDLRDLDKVLDGAKLVAYGDSLTAFGTWPLSVAQTCNMYLFNGATGGINTDEALARFDKYVANREADFVTLCFGMNDLLMQSKNNPQVTPENFKANMELMCQKIEDMGATPILLTSSYLDESKFYSSQGQTPAFYEEVGGPLAWLDVYNDMTKQVAAEGGYHLVDIRAACDEYAPADFLDADGIHLGEIGNQVYTDKISEYLLSTFVIDPEAEKITTWFPYVASPAEPATTDILSYDPAKWDSPVPSDMTFANDENGALLIANTNGKWPDAHYAADTSLLVPMEGSELVFDISTANVNASILLFFGGATPFAPTEGKWIVINPFLGGTTDPGSGDITANQNLKGSVKLADLGIPATALDENGNLLVSGVKIFAAGTAGQNVTVRQLAISTTGAPVQ